QGIGTEIPRIGALRKLVRIASIIQTGREITVLFQIMVHLEGGPEHRDVVVVERVRLGHAPELSLLVVAVRDGDLPTVLIHVENPARVDMPLSRLQRPFNHPDAMEFITRQAWVNVALSED